MAPPFAGIPRPGTGGLIDPLAAKKVAAAAPKVRSAAARAAGKLPFARAARARILLSRAAERGLIPIPEEVTGIRMAKPTNLRELLPREEEEEAPPEAAKAPEKGPGFPGAGIKPGVRPLFPPAVKPQGGLASPPPAAPQPPAAPPRSAPPKPPGSTPVVDGSSKTLAMQIPAEVQALIKSKTPPPAPPTQRPPGSGAAGASSPARRPPEAGGKNVPGPNKGRSS